MINRRTIGFTGLLAVVLSVSPLAGDLASKKFFRNYFNPPLPESREIIMDKACEIIATDHEDEISVLRCQRYFEINGNRVNVGPKYLSVVPELKISYRVPLSFYEGSFKVY